MSGRRDAALARAQQLEAAWVGRITPIAVPSMSLVERWRFRRAAMALDELCAQNPADLEAIYWAGLLYRRLGLFQECLERLATVHACATHADTALHLSYCAIRVGEHSFASGVLREALATTPSDSTLLYLFGVSCFLQGRLVEAERAFWSAGTCERPLSDAGRMLQWVRDVRSGIETQPSSAAQVFGELRP